MATTPKKKRKPGRPKNRSRAGRKPIMTAETLQKLEDAYKMDCTDLEACLSAGISSSTLYKFQTENPEFKDRKALLKKTPSFIARSTVLKNIKTDKETAKWWLERREKDSFSKHTTSDVDLTGDVEINITYED